MFCFDDIIFMAFFCYLLTGSQFIFGGVKLELLIVYKYINEDHVCWVWLGIYSVFMTILKNMRPYFYYKCDI